MSEHSLELKGSLFPLSVLHCTDLSVSTLESLLSAKLAQAPGFFYQAPIVLNLHECETIPDFTAIKNLFIELKLVLVGVTGASVSCKTAAQQAGLAVLQAGKTAQEKQNSVNTNRSQVSVAEPVMMDSKVLEQTVRSGQQVYAKGADLIIKGSVSAGAEVIADGNIHIYGALRGKAIAGANGDTSKRIYCTNMKAELVSVAGNYWLSDSLQGELWGKAACIRLQDDSLVISELV